MRKTLILAFGLLLFCPSFGLAGPIYVSKDRDGVIRFSNRPPPAGVQAKVFSARKSNFSWYKIQGWYPARLYRQEYQTHIRSAARKYKVSEELIRAVIHAESAFNPRAVSPKGARGLMQLMPDRARLLGVKNSFMPAENIEGGVKHLAFLLKRFSGNLSYALAAYNAGEGAVEEYGGIPPYSETREYVRKVIQLMERYSVRKR